MSEFNIGKQENYWSPEVQEHSPLDQATKGTSSAKVLTQHIEQIKQIGAKRIFSIQSNRNKTRATNILLRMTIV